MSVRTSGVKTLVLCCAITGCGGALVSGKDAAVEVDLGANDAASANSDGAVDVDATVPVDAAGACKALFCDNFEESATIDKSLWTIDTGYVSGDTLGVETDLVAHGTRAAHAHIVTTGGESARLHETKTFPALADGLWGRMYFYTQLAAMAGHTGFIEVYAGKSSVLGIGTSGGDFQLTRYDSQGEHPQGGPAIPHNEWVCFEWHFDRTAPSGSDFIEVYIDGMLTKNYKSGGEAMAPFTELSIGIDNHVAVAGMNDVYVDDIAIDAARIGCL